MHGSAADHGDGVAENPDLGNVHHDAVPLAEREVAARHHTRSGEEHDAGGKVDGPEQPLDELGKGALMSPVDALPSKTTCPSRSICMAIRTGPSVRSHAGTMPGPSAHDRLYTFACGR